MNYSDIDLYKNLHKQKPKYGASGHNYVDKIYEFVKETRPTTILDFGCGKETLKESLLKFDINVDGYDPAIANKGKIPLEQYDMIITTDVLEHIHEQELDNLFSDMMKLKPKFMFHVICNRPAYNKLPDGSNAHKTIEDEDWWKTKLESFFVNFRIDTFKQNDVTICKMFAYEI